MIRTTRLTLLALVALGSLATSACVKKESVDSTDVATQGMSLELEVKNDGVESRVYAALHVGSYQSLVWAKLSTGDELVLTTPDGTPHQLGVIYSGDKTAYGKNLSAMEGTYKVDFKRAKGISALNNVLVMPPSFTMTVPTVATSRKETLKINWTRADGTHGMRVVVDGPCIIGYSRDVIGDPGEFVINGGELKSIGGKEAETCQVTATVTRTISTGSGFSAEFSKHPSNATGVQTRRAMLDSKP